MQAIICMAGNSTRLNIGDNKAFVLLDNKPIFMHSVNKILNYVDVIYLSVREIDLPRVKPYLNKKIKVVLGGNSRSESVYNAMKLIPKDEKVLIHDAARPFLCEKILKSIVSESPKYDAILPYLPLKYTLYQAEPFTYLNRENYIVAQTPQMVKVNDFIKSYELALKEGFVATDDVSLVLRYNPEIKVLKLLDTDRNFKITTKHDLDIAKSMISESK